MEQSAWRALLAFTLYQLGKISSESLREHIQELPIHDLIILHSKLGEKSLNVLMLLRDEGIEVEEKESEKYEDVNKIVEFILLDKMKSLSAEDFLPYFAFIQNKDTIACLSAGFADVIERKSAEELISLFKKSNGYLDAIDIILDEFKDALEHLSRGEVIRSIEDDIPDMLERAYLKRLDFELPGFSAQEFERVVSACSNELVMRAYNEILKKLGHFNADSLVIFLNNAWKINNAEETEKIIRDMLIMWLKKETVEQSLKCMWNLHDTEAVDRIIFECLFERYDELLKYLDTLREKKEEK